MPRLSPLYFGLRAEFWRSSLTMEIKGLIKSMPLLVQTMLLFVVVCRGYDVHEGTWELLLGNGGVSAMHVTLLHTDKVLIFDQTEAGPSQIKRTDPPCNSKTPPANEDCWAHSVEYDIAANAVRPLRLVTDTWCSAGAFGSNGTLVHTGGYHNGYRVIRHYTPCLDAACDWVETRARLSANRWYASAQILPNRRIIVVGGRRAFSYEFAPQASGERAFELPFLVKTNVRDEENNLYPFTHLSSDGNLFIFANRDSILLDYGKNRVVRTFPTMPGGGARNYPSCGSSVMLPLESSDGFHRVEVLVCGGASEGAFKKAKVNNTFVRALESCGRMEITSDKPQWAMEDMPGPRVMGDMLILPTGEILIINGAETGTAGYGLAREAALMPFLYRAAEAAGRRFQVLASAKIPRVYHSTANVLPDGRVLVGGSNSHYGYTFSGEFPTELGMEAYVPYYLRSHYDPKRPNITSVSTREIKYGSQFSVYFSLPGQPTPKVLFYAYAPPFTTHSFSMNQRMLSLAATKIVNGSMGYWVRLTVPPSAVVAPSGYYLLWVVNGGVPSKAEWIRFVE